MRSTKSAAVASRCTKIDSKSAAFIKLGVNENIVGDFIIPTPDLISNIAESTETETHKHPHFAVRYNGRVAINLKLLVTSLCRDFANYFAPVKVAINSVMVMGSLSQPIHPKHPKQMALLAIHNMYRSVLDGVPYPTDSMGCKDCRE
jgi:hypothetical protein